MPPIKQPQPEKTLQQIVEEVGLYPIEAYEFVQQGLGYAVEKFHGPQPRTAGATRRKGGRDADDTAETAPGAPSRHIDGRQLCVGLREFALMNWGMLARTVLRRWNVTHTIDFGRIVFALVANGYLQKTDEDSIEDFRDVYDFKSAFETEYRIEHAPDQPQQQTPHTP